MKIVSTILDTSNLPDSQSDPADRALKIFKDGGDLFVLDNHPNRFSIHSIVQGRPSGAEAAFPQSPNSGWSTYTADRQERGVDLTVIDEKYLVFATAVWGWGVLDRESMRLVKQYEPYSGTSGAWGVTINGTPHVIIAYGRESYLWDVSDALNAVRVKKLPDGITAVVQRGSLICVLEEEYNPDIQRTESVIRLYDSDFKVVWAIRSGGSEQYYGLVGMNEGFAYVSRARLGRGNGPSLFVVGADGSTLWKRQFDVLDSVQAIGGAPVGVVVAGTANRVRGCVWIVSQEGIEEYSAEQGISYESFTDVESFYFDGKQYLVTASKKLCHLWDVEAEHVPEEPVEPDPVEPDPVEPDPVKPEPNPSCEEERAELKRLELLTSSLYERISVLEEHLVNRDAQIMDQARTITLQRNEINELLRKVGDLEKTVSSCRRRPVVRR